MNHLNAPGDKTNNLVHVTLTLGVDLFFENFNLANNISNWDLSDPLCDSINRGLTLVKLGGGGVQKIVCYGFIYDGVMTDYRYRI